MSGDDVDRGPGGHSDYDAGPGHLRLLPLLRRVSRAFYLSIRVLPERVRQPVGLAYLLARMADTIADTTAVSPEHRLRYLLEFRRLLRAGPRTDLPLDLIRSVVESQPTGAERDLLSSVPAALKALRSLEIQDRDLVTAIVSRLTEGMEFDLTRFPSEQTGLPEQTEAVRSLDSARELDRYTYLVAGCVGEFWTRVIVAHTPSLANWDIDHMTTLGIAFGKALQMTNVLRDVPVDLRAGRCYLPREWLDELGLSAQDLLDPDNSCIARPVLVRGVELALEHFDAAERYVTLLPRRGVRLRLAAMWPLLMGLGTLYELARNPDWLNPGSRSRVTRLWVYRMIAFSVLVGQSNRAVSWWARRLKRRVVSALTLT